MITFEVVGDDIGVPIAKVDCWVRASESNVVSLVSKDEGLKLACQECGAGYYILYDKDGKWVCAECRERKMT